MALLWMLTTLEPYLKLKPSSVSELTALRKGTSSRTASVSPSMKLDALAGALAAGLHAGLSAPDHDDVVAEAEEAVEDAFAEALAVAEQKDDGDEAPDDAEHGEAGAQAVAQEGVDALANDLNAGSWLLRPQTFHGAEVGGAQRGVHAGEEGDGGKGGERGGDGERRDDGMRDEVGQGSKLHQ